MESYRITRYQKATPIWNYSELHRISYRICWAFVLFCNYFGSAYSGAGAAAFPALVMVVVARYIPKEDRVKHLDLLGLL